MTKDSRDSSIFSSVKSLFKQSLSARLTITFLSLSVVTVFLATFVSYKSAETALRERLVEQLEFLADADATTLVDWISKQRDALEFIAISPGARGIANASHSRYSTYADSVINLTLAGMRQSLISANEVLLLGVPGGRVLASTDSASVGSYGVDQLFYRNGRDSTFTQHLYPDGPTGRPTMTISTPLHRTDGSTGAVLAAHLDLTEMERVLTKRDGTVPVEVFLINQFAEFVSTDRFGQPEHLRGVRSFGVDRALEGAPGWGLYTNHENRAVVGAWRWVPEHQLALLLEAPQSAAFAPARDLLIRALLVGLVLTSLLTLGIVGITRRVSRPILSVAAAARRVAEGDFNAEATVESEDEVGQLAQTFNAMTHQLRSLYGELESQVTATRAALHQARASRTLLQDVVDNTTTIVVVVGLDGRIRLANNRFESLLGLARGAAIGRPLSSALHGSTATSLLNAVDRAQRRSAVIECEIELTTGHESHTWQAVVFPLRDPAGIPHSLGIIATDLTERARSEEERRHRDASVQQAQKLESLGILAGGIAHDFNNILGAVYGNVDLALSAVDNPDVVRESLEQIAGATKRASELTRQMLAYAGRASLRREVIDVRAVLKDIVTLVRAGQSKKVNFVTHPMEDPLWVELDPSQLSQVVLNLLTNAAEAIGQDSGTVTLTATESYAHEIGRGEILAGELVAGSDGEWIKISVTDTGIGLSDEVKSHISEPFFSTKGQGRGLGLSAVNGIIRSVGGLLFVDSELGNGTRFDVYIPAAKAPVKENKVAREEKSVARFATILVIDDEAPLRRVCRRALEAVGHKVLEAADGEEGLAAFRKASNEIDLIVLDLTMPGMGGLEILQIIRQEKPDLPVVIASGYDHTDGAGGLPSDPHTNFLQKPFGIHMLTRVVSDLLV